MLELFWFIWMILHNRTKRCHNFGHRFFTSSGQYFWHYVRREKWVNLSYKSNSSRIDDALLQSSFLPHKRHAMSINWTIWINEFRNNNIARKKNSIEEVAMIYKEIVMRNVKRMMQLKILAFSIEVVYVRNLHIGCAADMVYSWSGF